MYIATKYAEHPLVKPFGQIVYDQINIAGSLIIEMAGQGTKRPLSITNKVSFMSLFRLRESLHSVLLLALNGFVRDASVLLLTLIELKLDVKYIGCNSNLAHKWIEHSKENTKPWKVSDLILALYPDLSEYEANKEIYRYFSGIKHANPAIGKASFPLGVSDSWLVFDDDQNKPNLIGIALFAAGSEGFEIIDMALETFSSTGFSIGIFKDSVAKSQENLSKLNAEHVHRMLCELIQRDIQQQ
ncbi:hypothetical protein TRIP_C20082 [Candidatus Zixiibacteriota bacterium]|nr:hypothetical protein TRIP_C20082 [candidate division Zixibacteria bacterium]